MNIKAPSKPRAPAKTFLSSVCDQVLQAKAITLPGLFSLREPQPAGPHVPVMALPKMIHDGSLRRGALWQTVQLVRVLSAEHGAKDPIVIVARPRNQGKSPLKGQNV